MTQLSSRLQPSTKQFEKALNGPKARYSVAGYDGLELRVAENGTGTWWRRVKHPVTGKREWCRVANVTKQSALGDVFDKYREMREAWEVRGVHPKHGDDDAPAMLTLGECFEQWLHRPRDKHYRDTTLQKYAENFERYVRMPLGDLPANEITSRMIRDHVGKLAKELAGRQRGQYTRGAQANKTLDMIRQALEWARKNDLVDHNEAEKVDKPVAEKNPDGKRHRAPNAEEIRRLWHATFELPDATVARALRLQMLLARIMQQA
jgi:hypothetical protein